MKLNWLEKNNVIISQFFTCFYDYSQYLTYHLYFYFQTKEHLCHLQRVKKRPKFNWWPDAKAGEGSITEPTASLKHFTNDIHCSMSLQVCLQ